MTNDIGCDETIEKLLAYLNRELPDEEAARVGEHVAECPRCESYSRMVEDAVCQEIYQHVQAYLDHELSADDLARVQHHLSFCARCQLHFSFDGKVLHYVRERARNDAPPEPVLERILEGFRARIRDGSAGET
jgi:anti-sigma factor (TIGR02949 family)